MPGAAKWIFNLRKGVEFHNGKSLVADDVIDSLNLHKGETKSIAKAYMRSVKDIKADGKNRVIITLEAGNADFPFFLADVHLTIQPAGTTDFNDGIGTGGYKLVRFEPGVDSYTKRNPNYWKEGRAHFDEIETLCIADVTARTNAMKTGKIDAMNNCDLKTIHLLKKDPNIQVIRITGSKHYTFPMHTDRAPFNNNDVRLGLKYAIDRKQVLRAVLRGYGSLGNDTPIGPTYQYCNKDLPQRKYDPDKAKFHMKKANALDYTFKLSTSDAAFPGAIDAAVLYKEHAAKCGIKIDVVREPSDGFWKNVWMKKDWCMSYWSGKPTEDWMFSQAYAAESNWNETFWTNERFNQLLKEARSELDKAKRREMYAEMQRILWAEGGTVIPMFADFVDAAGTKVKYKNIAGNFCLDGRRCSERWWFAG
jgi:peptide/nickel transport system substrate-binding protein